MPGRLVLIEWLDSSGSDGWHYKSAARGAKALHIASVGWIIGESADAVWIAPHLEESDPDDPQMRGDLRIPRAAVKSIKDVAVMTIFDERATINTGSNSG